jgi:enterochelin esterase-like enzyme
MENTPNSPVPHVSSGTISRFDRFISKYVDARNVDIWLPAGYDPQQKYAVIYMHDGQMLFDPSINWNHEEWGIDETLGGLMAQKKIRPCKALTYLKDGERGEIMGRFYGKPAQADNYLKFIINELKPEVDKHYSTYTDQQNTFIMGSSMGALISLYAICEYPNIFCGAGCLSTHWIGVDRAENNPIPYAVLGYMQDHLPNPYGHRFYFDYGSATLDRLYKPFQLKANELMHNKGYTYANWVTDEFPGDDHSENAWNRRFHIPAEFFLGYK